MPPEGPYAGLPLHVVVTVPVDYPNKPPKIFLTVKVPHPNVFDWGEQYICLDMLKEYGEKIIFFSFFLSLLFFRSLCLSDNLVFMHVDCISISCSAGTRPASPIKVGRLVTQWEQFCCNCKHFCSTITSRKAMEDQPRLTRAVPRSTLRSRR